MKKRLLVFSLALVLLLALFCACDSETPHTHTYDQKNVADKYLKSAATATAPTEYYYSCQCGERGEQTFTFGEALGGADNAHVYRNEWSYDNDSHWRACIDLSCDSRANLAAHTFGEWVVDKEPTCVAEGTRHHVCTVCGETVSEAIPIDTNAHNYATAWTSDGTHHWHSCQNSGCVSVQDEAEHTDFGAWVTDKEPTCVAQGARHHDCTVCGKSVGEMIPIDTNAHNYATMWTLDETHHWHQCRNTGCTSVKDKAEHSAVGGTCTKCSYAGNGTRFTVRFEYRDADGNPIYVKGIKGENNATYKDVTVFWGNEGTNSVLGNITAFDDYVIIGWDTDGDKQADDGLRSVKNNMTVTSIVRAKNEFDVTLLRADGTEFAKIKVKEGNALPEIDPPFEYGKRFVGWQMDTWSSCSTANSICDDCTFKAAYSTASSDGVIGKVATGSIQLDGVRDEAYNQSGAYLPINTQTQADGYYYDTSVRDVDHGGPRAVPTVDADAYVVWDGDYIYMIIEVSDKTCTTRGAAYMAKGIDAWCNDGVELWYTFEQDLVVGSNNYTRVGIDALGTSTYALARSKGIGQGRSTHFEEIRYAVRHVLNGDTGSDLSRTGYADASKTTSKASYIIEYMIPAWTEGEADVANYPGVNVETGLLPGRSISSNNINDYAFTSGDKLKSGDIVRFSLQINDLMIAKANMTGATGTYYWDCPPADKIPLGVSSNEMLYATDGKGNITSQANLTGLFSACGHTNHQTQYYIAFALGANSQAETKIWGLAGHPATWNYGVETRTFYTTKDCRPGTEYVRP